MQPRGGLVSDSTPRFAFRREGLSDPLRLTFRHCDSDVLADPHRSTSKMTFGSRLRFASKASSTSTMSVISQRRSVTPSFRIALRPEPIYAAGTLHPIVKVGFANQAFDVLNLRAGTVGLDLPIALRDAFRLEYDFDFRGFAHAAEYAPTRLGRKPYFKLTHYQRGWRRARATIRASLIVVDFHRRVGGLGEAQPTRGGHPEQSPTTFSAWRYSGCVCRGRCGRALSVRLFQAGGLAAGERLWTGMAMHAAGASRLLVLHQKVCC
jgi:hypothetical protein